MVQVLVDFLRKLGLICCLNRPRDCGCTPNIPPVVLAQMTRFLVVCLLFLSVDSTLSSIASANSVSVAKDSLTPVSIIDKDLRSQVTVPSPKLVTAHIAQEDPSEEPQKVQEGEEKIEEHQAIRPLPINHLEHTAPNDCEGKKFDFYRSAQFFAVFGGFVAIAQGANGEFSAVFPSFFYFILF
jgi:hypothetical protein